MSRRTKDAPLAVTLPTVNLLSESAFSRLAARRLRRFFLVAGFVMVLLVGAAWAAQHMRVTEARKVVAVEQSETDRLNSQTEVLAPVRTFVTGVAQQQQTVTGAMSDEIYFSEVLDGIRGATPVGADIESLAVTIASADPNAAASGTTPTDASTCPGPDPFNTRTVVGCVTLSGTAESRSEVGQMVIALGDSRLFVEPFINTTTTGDSDAVSFSGSVGLSERVYSKRYGDPEAAPTTAGSGS